MAWVELEPQLSAQQCATCGGVGLGAIEYWNWLQQELTRATVTTPYQKPTEAPYIKTE